MNVAMMQAVARLRGEYELEDLLMGAFDNVFEGVDPGAFEFVTSNQSPIGLRRKTLQFRLADGRIINARWQLQANS